MKKSKNNSNFFITVILIFSVYIGFCHYLQYKYEKLNDKLQAEINTLINNCITPITSPEENEYENP